MKFSTALILSAAAAPAMAAGYTNATSTETAIHKTVVTITSCVEDKCHETPVTTGVTTVTENETVYTTYCPLPSESTTGFNTWFGPSVIPSLLSESSAREAAKHTKAPESASTTGFNTWFGPSVIPSLLSESSAREAAKHTKAPDANNGGNGKGPEASKAAGSQGQHTVAAQSTAAPSVAPAVGAADSTKVSFLAGVVAVAAALY